MKKDVQEILKELNEMVGKEFDYTDIGCVFTGDDEECIINEVEGQGCNFDGHGYCKCWNAYYNDADSEVFNIYVDEDNEIVAIS